MKLSFRMLAAAFVLALIVVSLSAGLPGDGLVLLQVEHSSTATLAVGLIALRADLDQLTKRAADKIAEIKEDTPPEQVRTIQDDHAKLLAEIEVKRQEIAKEEKAEADRAAAAASTTPPADVSRAEAARAADMLDLGTRAGMANAEIQEAIRSGTALDVFRTRAFDFMATRVSQTHTSPGRVIRDEREATREASIEAMAYRLGAPQPQNGPAENVRARMNMGLIRLAMDCVGERNYPESASEREGLFIRASHSTSDFPIIMEGAVNRTLEGRYALSQPTYRNIARRRDFRDFKPHTIVKTGDFPLLQKIVENGEIKYGTLTEGKEAISVLSYAIAISISRAMMINDDLGAIQDMLSDYGTTVALFEEITFYSEAFNGKLADGKTVFHTDHGNLAGAGTAIDVDAVSAGRAAMAKQKSLSGNPIMSNVPAQIVTGPDRITSAEKLLASITPATVANVNIFSGRFSAFSTPQIAGTPWYMFPALEQGSNYRWGYLEGYEAPRVRIDTPFGRQGMSMSVEHDFGCGAVDHRHGWKNPGQ